jgi:hypothetical protein
MRQSLPEQRFADFQPSWLDAASLYFETYGFPVKARVSWSMFRPSLANCPAWLGTGGAAVCNDSIDVRAAWLSEARSVGGGRLLTQEIHLRIGSTLPA